MKTGWKIAFQGVVTLALMAWLLQHFDWMRLRQHLSSVQPGWFAAAVLLYLFNLSLSALRWRFIMHSLDRPMPLSLLLRLNWVGAFFNQVLPGAVSGDAVRAFYTRPYTNSFTVALAAVLSERILGLGALLLLVGWVYGLGHGDLPRLDHMSWLITGFGLAYVGAVAVILSPRLDRFVPRLGRLGEKVHEARLSFRALFRHGRDLAWVLLLSLLVQLLSVLLFWAAGLALGLELQAVAVWVVWPIVSLLTFLPLSLAGWGVREGLVVFYLTQLGVAGDKAFAVSLLTGLAILLASLPGGLVWLMMGRKNSLKELNLNHEN